MAEQRLLGGCVFGLTTFGVSSSLDEDILFVFEGLLCLGSSFFFGSSTVFVGDFGGGAGVALVGGVSDTEDSESELEEPEPELVEELPLLLESDEDPELLSLLLLLA